MNILPIAGFSPAFLIPKKNNISQNTRSFGLVMSKPLSRDTVSFTSTPKAMKSRKNAITMQLAKVIHEEAVKATEYMDAKLRPYIQDLEATTFKPKNPIERISSRAKASTSIIEKATTRDWINKDEIKRYMTDLAGVRIVMRDASREQVDRVIDRLRQAVTEGGVNILEIENKRPLPIYNQLGSIVKSYDYASPLALIKLQRAASMRLGREIKLIDENTESNYMAIHILMELPNGITGEIQIMGHDVAALKDLEDLCYKVKNDKDIDKKYASIEKFLLPLKDEKNSILIAEQEKYTQAAYIYQRELEPRAHKSRKKEKFLEAPATLPKEFDFNYIYKQKLACDAAAAKSARKAKEKSKTAKQTVITDNNGTKPKKAKEKSKTAKQTVITHNNGTKA